ncbi:hypothetical protein HY29_06460 [Hyphomonas beringensis]|uniref:Uncharacterized protein n=2 Tax=Hyphomonas beringensis TaxID=1280946 RepID=A0A062TZR9_9PROT|nr:hypothetical protein HY29_06460 [Hyphomonas beringensis]
MEIKMSPQTMADDLAYIRDLAEAGKNAPLLGGRFLVLWGGLTTAAYIGHYAIAEGMFGLQPVAFAIMWIAYAILGVGGMYLLKMSYPDSKPGRASTGNKVSALVWQASGYFLGAYFLGAFLSAMIFDVFSPFLWSVPMVVGLYGLSQYVSGVISNTAPLKLAGILAMLSVVPAILLSGTNYMWLLGSAVAAVCVLAPGIILMRHEPSETV